MPRSNQEQGTSDGHLTDRSYWDTVHQGPIASGPSAGESGEDRAERPSVLRPGRSKTSLRWIRESFGQNDFWNRLLPRFVPVNPSGKVLEVGVAPGDDVLRFRECFGYEPFGIEFSRAGVEATRRNFAAHGVPGSNVIEGDLFSDAAMAHHESAFDVVFSRGFIEHFTDPSDAIGRHLRLTKPGGLIVISIPTLTGFHYLLTRALMPHQIAIHNRGIMKLGPFRQLFARPDLEPLFCGYQGGPNFLISYTPNPVGLCATLQWWTFKAQGLANLAGWVSGGRLLSGPYLNGSLLFVGRKRT